MKKQVRVYVFGDDQCDTTHILQVDTYSHLSLLQLAQMLDDVKLSGVWRIEIYLDDVHE